MSFDSDLSRWASATLARLRRLASTSAENVRRLIDYPFDSSAPPPSDRGPIPGVPGIALLFPPEEPPEVEFELERGLGLVVDDVYRVYTHSSLAQEWGDEGPEWGWGKIHAQGIMSASDVQCAAAIAPTWTPIPILDSASSYTTLATVDEVADWLADYPSPNMQSGLMSLLLEAFGPFADVRDLIPNSWPQWESGHYGVVRFDDSTASSFRWYLVYLGPQGCRAVELRIDGLAACLVDGLYTQTSWTDAQRQLAEAWILRCVYLLDTDEGEELITSGDYAAAVPGQPLDHGWKFCHQRWDTGLVNVAQASIVVLELSTGAYDTRTVRCDFALTGGGMTAQLQTIATGRAHFGAAVRRNPLWLEMGGQLHAVDMQGAAPGDVINLSDVYLVDYDDTGPLAVKAVKEETSTTPAEPGRSGSSLTACSGGAEERENWWKTATTLRTGGYIVGPVFADREIVAGSGEQVDRRFKINFFGSVIDVITFDLPDFGQCAFDEGGATNIGVAEAANACRARCCEDDCKFGCSVSDLPFGQRTQGVRWAQGTQHILRRWERTYDADDNGGNALIIPANCATAVCVVSGQTTTRIDELAPNGQLSKDLPLDQFQGTRLRDFLPGTSGSYLFSLGQFRVVCFGYLDPPNQNPVCRLGDWLPVKWSSCSVGDPDDVCVIEADWESVGQQNNVQEVEAHWVSGRAVIPLQPDWNAWSPFLVASISQGEVRIWSPLVATQFGGSVLYQDVPNGNLKSNAGHDPSSVSSAVAARFVSS